MSNQFNEKKSIEITLYIAEELSRMNVQADFHKIFKLIYFADKEHLGKYGRLILNDDYVAMKHGPVLSNLYNLFKDGRDGHRKEDFLVVDGYVIKSGRKPEIEFISDSERECLNLAIANYGKCSFDELTELSHDLAWKSAGNDDVISVEAIAKSLPNHEELLKHLRDN